MDQAIFSESLEFPLRRPVSRLALASLFVSVAAFLAGPVWLSLPPFNFATEYLPKSLKIIPIVIYIFGFPVGTILAYITFAYCRIDGPTQGRSLAWIALAVSQVSIFFAYMIIAPLAFPKDFSFGLHVLVMFALVHVFIMATESAAGKYLAVSILLGGMLFVLLSPWILRSNSMSRQFQCKENLRQIAIEMLVDQGHDPKEQLDLDRLFNPMRD